MKKTTRKTTKKSLVSDVIYSLNVSQDVSKQFERASQKIKKQYDYNISAELLMLWILSGVHEDYLIKEFEEALASQSSAKNSRGKRRLA